MNPYVLIISGRAGDPATFLGTRARPMQAPIEAIRRWHGLTGELRLFERVCRRNPRLGLSSPCGAYVEMRYVDPRPGAPRCISPVTQEA